MFGIKQFVKLNISKLLWSKKHPDNQMVPGNVFPDEIVTVGRASYGVLNIDWNGTQSKLDIGSYCSIAPDVWFVINSEHNTDTPSTYPFRVKLLGQNNPEAGSKGGIVVEDDVWIGFGATILDGVTIHQGAIVGAGAVVAKDVPPYTIVGGIPAKPIKKRFNDDVVELLLRFDWSRVDNTFIEDNIGLLYKKDFNRLDAELLLSKLECAPYSLKERE